RWRTHFWMAILTIFLKSISARARNGRDIDRKPQTTHVLVWQKSSPGKTRVRSLGCEPCSVLLSFIFKVPHIGPALGPPYMMRTELWPTFFFPKVPRIWSVLGPHCWVCGHNLNYMGVRSSPPRTP